MVANTDMSGLVERRVSSFLFIKTWRREILYVGQGLVAFSSDETQRNPTIFIPQQALTTVGFTGRTGVYLTYRAGPTTKKLLFRCKSEGDAKQWVYSFSKAIALAPSTRPLCMSAHAQDRSTATTAAASETTRALGVKLLALRLEKKLHYSLQAALNSLCLHDPAVAGVITEMSVAAGTPVNTHALVALYLSAKVRCMVQRHLHLGLFMMMRHSVSTIQCDALTAAESLAAMNMECLNKLDSMPLQIGVKTISALVAMTDFKLKLFAMNELRAN